MGDQHTQSSFSPPPSGFANITETGFGPVHDPRSTIHGPSLLSFDIPLRGGVVAVIAPSLHRSDPLIQSIIVFCITATPMATSINRGGEHDDATPVHLVPYAIHVPPQVGRRGPRPLKNKIKNQAFPPFF